MAKPYSMDLRERVVVAVIEDGMSCHAAAARFGVAVSSAIKWVQRYRETGSAAPKPMGGRKPNILSGVTRDWLLERVTSDFTLRGLVAELAVRGVKVDYVQVWRFAHAFFAKLTRRRLKNGAFHSVVDLQAAINRFTTEHNQEPRPFTWRADPDQIIAAVRRGHQTLEPIH